MCDVGNGGLCEICNVEVSVGNCRLCGRRACRNHLGSDGICAVCKDLMCADCGIRLSITSCIVCRKLICRECSVELQPGLRVCKKCFKSLPEIMERNPALRYLSRYYRVTSGSVSGVKSL